MEEEKIQKIMIVIFLISLIGMTVFGIFAVVSYQKAVNHVDELQSEMHLEVLRINSKNDGSELKALFYMDPDDVDKKDHSIPFIIACHGMSGSYLQFGGDAVNFVDRGYAVLIPEFRGHGSSVPPSTLGYAEPHDIIQWLDYIEGTFKAINISASGIVGQSMGALYATSAYIIESNGEGRLKALVAASGPINLTREVDFLSDDIDAIGPLAFSENIEEKNPINHVDDEFPINIMLLHGDEDNVVDYQCSTDFIRVIDSDKLDDPDDGREDVEFYTLEGEDHGIDHTFFLGKSIYWFDRHILNKSTDYKIEEQPPYPFNRNYAKDFQSALHHSLICLVFLIPTFLYLIKPQIFQNPYNVKSHKKKQDNVELGKEIDTENSDSNISVEVIDDNSAEDTIDLSQITKRKILGVLLSITILCGIISVYAIHTYIVSELILLGIGTLMALLLSVKLFFEEETKKKLSKMLGKWLNLRNGVIVGLPIILCSILIIVIPSLPLIEDSTLVPGKRVTWWVPFMVFYFVIQLTSNIILIRILNSDWDSTPKMRFSTAVRHGGLYGVLLFVFFAFLLNQAHIMGIELVFLVSAVFGFVFFLFDLSIQIIEKITKSLLPGIIICALIIPIIVGDSAIIFIY